MRIERFRIENFRRFKVVDVELPDGVTALVGRNGAGKSSILEAIGWCLYGNDAARTGKELIKRRGAAPGDDVRVHLAFRFGAHVYEVTRELLGKSAAHVATVKVDGGVAVPAGAASQKEATAYIERLFHMDREAFFTSLVARQRELAALTDAKAADRKRILIGLLRLDAVDHAIQAARARKRDAKSELAGLRSALHDPAPMREALGRVRKELEADELRTREIEARIAGLVEEVEECRATRDASRKKAEDHRLLQQRLAMAQERVGLLARDRERRHAELTRAQAAAAEAATLAPKLALLPDARAKAERFQALRVRHDELTRTRAELGKAQAEAEKAEQEAAAAAAALAAAGTVRSLSERVATQRPRVEAQLADLQRQLGETQAQAAERARLLHEVEGKEKRIRDMGPESPCPTCTRPLREHHDELLHGFRDEIGSHRATLAQLSPQLDTLRRQQAETQAQLKALGEREAELRVKLANLAREEERQLSATARAADARARQARLADQERFLAAEPYDAKADDAARADVRALELVRERHARLAADAERAAEIQRVLDEIGQQETLARAAVAEAENLRAALAFDPAQHDALERAATTCEGKLTDARLLRERLAGERARRADEEKRLVADLERQDALVVRARDLEGRVQLLEQLAGDRDVGLLPEFKDHLISRVRPLLSTHAGRLFREVTEGRYADLEVGEDYGLRIHDEGQAFELARFSGGEGDLANLCLRLAVSQVVAERAGSEGFGFLALDEIFGSQDEVRKSNILQSLRGLSGRFRQILIITHIGDVKDAAEHVLRVEALDDGTSRVVMET